MIDRAVGADKGDVESIVAVDGDERPETSNSNTIGECDIDADAGYVARTGYREWIFEDLMHGTYPRQPPGGVGHRDRRGGQQ